MKLKINIASFGGRTHMLDTARELEECGHEVRFYSYVPTSRAVKFGLNPKSNKSYFLLSIPFLFLQKITNRSFWSLYIFQWFFDFYVALIMPKCDVFIGQSPMHIFSLKYAKKKYGAVTILERGSTHILRMVDILSNIQGKSISKIMPKYFLNRDLLGYELADFISIASEFQKKSFLEFGVRESKLFVNMYGASIDQFPRTNFPKDSYFDVLFVGNWSLQKGCDLLISAVEALNLSLLHVGAIGDCEFPNGGLFTHIDPVNQNELSEYYKRAKVFVLPSRQDGFGMVLCQAAASGLPIVCSEYTGGPDLRKLFNDSDFIFVMEKYNKENLIMCLKMAINISETQKGGLRDYLGKSIEELTWKSYGRRYDYFLNSLTNI